MDRKERGPPARSSAQGALRRSGRRKGRVQPGNHEELVGWRLGEQGSAGSATLNASFSRPLVIAGHSDAIGTSSLSGLRCDPDKRRSDGLRLIVQRFVSGRTRSSASRLCIARILCGRHADSSKAPPLILTKPTLYSESRNRSDLSPGDGEVQRNRPSRSRQRYLRDQIRCLSALLLVSHDSTIAFTCPFTHR